MLLGAVSRFPCSRIDFAKLRLVASVGIDAPASRLQAFCRGPVGEQRMPRAQDTNIVFMARGASVAKMTPSKLFFHHWNIDRFRQEETQLTCAALSKFLPKPPCGFCACRTWFML